MQETRQHILEILKECNQATVDEIVERLQKRRGPITAVTVRHHLARLQSEDLITEPDLLHRSTPGRPQHVYGLTEKARESFPNNYQQLLVDLLDQIQERLPSDEVNVLFEGVVDKMASGIEIRGELDERLNIAVQFMNERGYAANWTKTDQGYMLTIANCPYHHVAESHNELCDMDMRLISTVLGRVPRLMSRASAGDPFCSYLVSDKTL